MQGAIGILSTTDQGLLPPPKFDRQAFLAAAATTQDVYAPVVAGRSGRAEACPNRGVEAT
jgi:hypothetical protein